MLIESKHIDRCTWLYVKTLFIIIVLSSASCKREYKRHGIPDSVPTTGTSQSGKHDRVVDAFMSNLSDVRLGLAYNEAVSLLGRPDEYVKLGKGTGATLIIYHLDNSNAASATLVFGREDKLRSIGLSNDGRSGVVRTTIPSAFTQTLGMTIPIRDRGPLFHDRVTKEVWVGRKYNDILQSFGKPDKSQISEMSNQRYGMVYGIEYYVDYSEGESEYRLSRKECLSLQFGIDGRVCHIALYNWNWR